MGTLGVFPAMGIAAGAVLPVPPIPHEKPPSHTVRPSAGPTVFPHGVTKDQFNVWAQASADRELERGAGISPAGHRRAGPDAPWCSGGHHRTLRLLRLRLRLSGSAWTAASY